MAVKRAPTPLDAERLAELADAVTSAARDAGFVARSKLGALGIPPAHRDAVLAEVARRGLEVDRRGARRQGAGAGVHLSLARLPASPPSRLLAFTLARRHACPPSRRRLRVRVLGHGHGHVA